MKLNKCAVCGGQAEWVKSSQSDGKITYETRLIRCSNPDCRIQTPELTLVHTENAELKVLQIWNGVYHKQKKRLGVCRAVPYKSRKVNMKHIFQVKCTKDPVFVYEDQTECPACERPLIFPKNR